MKNLQYSIITESKSKRRLLIFFCRKNTEYTDSFILCVRHILDDVIIVNDCISTKSDDSISFQTLKDMWPDLCRKYNYVYFVNEYWLFISIKFENVFDFCEHNGPISELCNKIDLFGDELLDELFYTDAVANPIFFCIQEQAFESIQTLLLAERSISRLYDRLHTDYPKLWNDKTFFRHLIDSSHFFDNNNEVPLAFGIYDYLNRFSLPFVYMGVFMMHRKIFIKYGTDNQIKKLYDNIIKSELLSKSIILFFKEKCDAAHLKNLLQINFIFSSYQNNSRYYEDTAVFAHLYYTEIFESDIEYLNKASAYCDVYISVSDNEKKKKVLSLVDIRALEHVHVINVENRGRDLSALLVGFAPYIKKYKFFCFLHDKRSHSGEVYTVGDMFRKCIWNNLIGAAEIIEAIREYFIDNVNIGLMVPPSPYWGVYLENKSNFWTICYQKTVELANTLGLTVSINNDINPITLGSAFWCRTEALKPLLENGWKYNDFDPEPLGIDGTFSHALERIFPYVALESGFLTGWIMSDTFASCMLESHVILLDTALKNEKKRKIFFSEEQMGVKNSFKLLVYSAYLCLKASIKFVLKKYKAFYHSLYKK